LEISILQLYGDGWSKIHINGWKKNPQISGDDFRLAIYSSKVTLGLLRKSNSDDSTMGAIHLHSFSYVLLDLLLIEMGESFLVQPRSIVGVLWLQTHFEPASRDSARRRTGAAESLHPGEPLR
jgi:hypothetical protein